MNSSLLALFLDKYPDVWLRFMEHMNMTTMAVLWGTIRYFDN